MTAAPAALRRIVPVILSGGSGTRLWPLSTQAAPKQFHALAGELTLIQQTALRFSGGEDPAFEAPAVICNARHLALVQDQLAAVGVAPLGVVLEPAGRNTAAAAVVAARLVQERSPGALVLLAPADHLIADAAAFRAAVARAAAVEGRISTFGVTPSRPETGYGYIEAGAAIGEGVREIARFVEKPDLAVAEGFLRAGGYFWNAGIFLFEPGLMIAEVGRHRPDLLGAVDAAWRGRLDEGEIATLPASLFETAPAVSIDVAVMEKTQRAAVVPFDAGWADLGSWSEVWRLAAKDGAGNALVGEAIALESGGSLVWGEGVVAATVGAQELIIVATGEATVVLPMSRAQDLKAVVEAVQALRLSRRDSGG
jgi:mannose-1-phosphate guanylyltransferase/mannose-6-phosphate isomerase